MAAVERAERHRGRSGAPIWLIFEHLGIPRRSRRIRVQIQALVDAGALTQRRAHGSMVWELTSKGRRRLKRAEPVALPESPQHLAWRNARTLAEQEIGRFRAALRSLLEETVMLLDEGETSDRWFELAERLRSSARRLGSTTYCLREWVEPDDLIADIDDPTTPLMRRLNQRSGSVAERGAQGGATRTFGWTRTHEHQDAARGGARSVL